MGAHSILSVEEPTCLSIWRGGLDPAQRRPPPRPGRCYRPAPSQRIHPAPSQLSFPTFTLRRPPVSRPVSAHPLSFPTFTLRRPPVSRPPLLPALSLCLSLPSWADCVDWAGALSLPGDTCSAVFGGILPCSHQREGGIVHK